MLFQRESTLFFSAECAGLVQSVHYHHHHHHHHFVDMYLALAMIWLTNCSFGDTQQPLSHSKMKWVFFFFLKNVNLQMEKQSYININSINSYRKKRFSIL